VVFAAIAVVVILGPAAAPLLAQSSAKSARRSRDLPTPREAAMRAPDVGAFRGIVTVDTAEDLLAEVRGIADGTTIIIAPGVYKLPNTLHLQGPSRNIVIRGLTGNPSDVVLMGRGMKNKQYGNVPHGILVDNVQDILIADLTIRDVYFHAITFQGGAGCTRPYIYNCHLINSGEQLIKANPDGKGGGVDGGIVERTRMGFVSTSRNWYTNGVDVLGGKGWVIRHCFFANIRAPDGELAGPAVLMWKGSADTICESNMFLNCQFGIAFGMSPGDKPDHSGGIIRSNIIFRGEDDSGDVGIAVWNSPGTKVLHNTVVLSGTFPNAIEYRFPGTKDCTIARNVCDGNITRRDRAAATLADNVTEVSKHWFVNLSRGDLHLTPSAEPLLDKVPRLEQVSEDYDGQPRPERECDLGADERSEAPHTKTEPAGTRVRMSGAANR
jgi:hypothetical protein